MFLFYSRPKSNSLIEIYILMLIMFLHMFILNAHLLGIVNSFQVTQLLMFEGLYILLNDI